MDKDNPTEITLTVGAPQLKSTAASKHHEYRIHGMDEMGQFDTMRRYSDFLVLKQFMQQRWPGVYVPCLPEKKFLGNNQVMFLEVRRSGLEGFLRYIAEQKYLWYGDEFQLFIKSKSSQVQKFLNNLGKTTPRQISTKYRTKLSKILQNLPQPSQPQSPSQADTMKISQFRAYLKNSYIILQKMGKVAEIMTDDRRKFNQKYQILLTNIVPNYQEQCVSSYADSGEKLVFKEWKVNGLAECQIAMSKVAMRNQNFIVTQLIREELREILSFQDILKNREEYEAIKFKAMSKKKDLEIEQSKIHAGKQSIFNKIKKATKEDQLRENQILLAKAADQLKDAEEICWLVDKILAYDQIRRFKEARQKNYYAIVKEMARVQKENLNLQEEFWDKVLRGTGGDVGMKEEPFQSSMKSEEKEEKRERKEEQSQEEKYQEKQEQKEETRVESSQRKFSAEQIHD